MLIKGNEINLPSLHDLSAHGWGHLTVPAPSKPKVHKSVNFLHMTPFFCFLLLYNSISALSKINYSEEYISNLNIEENT